MGLTVGEIVEHLEAEGQLGLPRASRWPSYDPEEFDAYLIDWHSLFGVSNREPIFQGIDDPELADWIGTNLGMGQPVGEEARREAELRPEVCAWYQPIHFHGHDWGIFILDDCMRRIAGDIARWVPRVGVGSVWMLQAPLLQMAFASLFLHEAYHHKTESFAVRLDVTERTPRYRNYWAKVFEPAARPRGGGPLEEALANADSFRRLNEPAHARFVPSDLVRSTRDYLTWRFPLDPPGYSAALNYIRDEANLGGQNLLKSQVQEGVAKPFRTVAQWRMAPNMNESLFGLSSDIWVLVRKGSRPTLPTFPLYRPVPSLKLEKALRVAYGYTRVKGGKGSHVKLKAPGYPTLILPGDRKDLSPVVLKGVAGDLGFRDSGEFLAAVGC
jgi:hypothetical protein